MIVIPSVKVLFSDSIYWPSVQQKKVFHAARLLQLVQEAIILFLFIYHRMIDASILL